MSIFSYFFGSKKSSDTFVVHLGNLGEDAGEKTRVYSKRFPNIKFVGIDTGPVPPDRPVNWEQIEGEFISGLKSLPNNSIDIVSSELAVGHYDLIINGKTKMLKEKYTKNIVRLIWKKLKLGGKVIIVVGDHTAERIVIKAVEKYFKINEIRPLSKRELNRTLYSRKYALKPHEYLSHGLYQISAKKVV
jgi:hypothetical protein